MTRDELLKNIHNGFHDFMTYLDTLSEADFVTNTDAAGWTVKDHVMHLVVWEDGMWPLLNGQPRAEHMGLPQDVWQSRDFDAMNTIIQQQHRDKPLGEVLQEFRDIHHRLIAKIESLADEDLQRPYKDYQPGTTVESPVMDTIIADTYDHYAEHRPWIDAIVSG